MAFPADTTHVADAPAGSSTLGGSTPTHRAHHADMAATLNAVLDELGANPSGASATVAARIAAVESAPSGTVTSSGITDSTTVGRAVLTATDAAAARGAIGAVATDARVFDVTNTTYAGGAKVDGTTDDTAAWQAAINACATAGGGVVTSSKNGVSIIGGALQDTSGANAQLLLPAVDYADGETLSVVIRGLTPPPSVFSVIGATPLPDNHLVLKSTLATGTGAVVGVKGPVGTFGSFSNVHLTVENLTVRTVTNPTLTGLDLRNVASADLDRVVVDTGSYDIDGLAQPTSSGSYGIRLPASNNGAHVRLGMVDVAGFYTGFEFAEHATGHVVSAWGCRVAAQFDATNHASVFLRFMAVHCTVGLKFAGAHSVDVWQFDIEHASSTQGWRQTTYDVDDASNYGSGFLRWWAVLANTGPHNVFTKNGGTGFTTSRVGAAIGSGGGGSSDYTYRDRLVAAAGNNVLTLGATPVTNSPLVWVNGAIKWPGTDYTISGSTITLGTPLSMSDVVAVQYRSTASSASASTLTGGSVNIADAFTRADSTSSLGSTTTGGVPWSVLSGTWGIASNKGYVSLGPGGGLAYAVLDSTVADCTISTVITASSGNPNAGLVLRATDASNLYLVEIAVGSSYTPKIYKNVAGTLTTIATGAAITFAAGDTLSAVLLGTSITVKRNGTTIVSVTDSTYTTQTKHGLYNYAPGVAGGARFDDLSITS